MFWAFVYVNQNVRKQPDETQMPGRLTARLHLGAVYLLYAVSETNAHVFGDVIDTGRADG